MWTPPDRDSSDGSRTGEAAPGLDSSSRHLTEPGSRNDPDAPFFGQAISIGHRRLVLLALGMLLRSPLGWSQLVPGSMEVQWSEGTPNCATKSQSPLQVHQYNACTFLLRESLCTTFEAPFMYLLVGATKALLIDTGDVADPKVIPLADSVMHLLPGEGPTKLPLLVVHTHRHLDHRAGDGQFMHLSNVQVVGFDIDSVRRYYNFTDWLNGLAQIHLGDRTVDVIPSPGHNETEISFY